jgi:superfamily II DNA/RNA helicase
LQDITSAASDTDGAPATDTTDTVVAAAPERRTTFADLGLSEPILNAVSESGYLHPTPIQEQAIPVVLMGRDVMGVAQTGTGKTASFVLPMLEILQGSRAKARMPRSLILEPTRELALQVAENFEKYGKHLKLTHALLIGGESMSDQRDVLDKGVDVLIATPGRLLDLFERGRVMLADTKILVIDEADRMLDMGFIPDVERIVSLLPKMRQTLFFSATMAAEIRRLSDAFLDNPKTITVSKPATVATTITVGLAWVHQEDKREALRRLVRAEQVQNALIFCNRKTDVDILYKSLKKHGFSAGALHGDMEQSHRFATLNAFKAGDIQLLVCSDVAARGLDIGGLSHVFNFDVPFRDEDYVHRIGRTGRAGREGRAFTLASPDDAKLVAAIEKLTGRQIPLLSIDGIEPPTEAEIEDAMSSKGRGRGRSRTPERGRSPRGAGRRDAEARPARDDARRAEPRRDEARRTAAPRRDEARRSEPRAAEPVLVDEAPRAEARRDPAPRRDDPRRDPPARRDEPRRDDRRRDRDDLGPAPLGFGDQLPAFMTLKAVKQRRAAARDPEPEAEAEAA